MIKRLYLDNLVPRIASLRLPSGFWQFFLFFGSFRERLKNNRRRPEIESEKSALVLLKYLEPEWIHDILLQFYGEP